MTHLRSSHAHRVLKENRSGLPGRSWEESSTVFLVVEVEAVHVGCMGTRQDAGETAGQASWRGQS